MDARHSNLKLLFQGDKQFQIPIYQRKYSWTQKECIQLWEDIKKVIEKEETYGHFIGSIVHVSEGLYQSVDVNKLLVIDGQQRITTISLLLNALIKIMEESQTDYSTLIAKIKYESLINQYAEEDKKIKLILAKSDNETYNCIIKKLDISKAPRNKVLDNFEFFLKTIEKSNFTPEQIYSGICKLFVIVITLENGKDNPQLIFESLNSTGLDLSQADLIRNFILMGTSTDLQKNLFEKYWEPLDKNFGNSEYSEKFDRFVKDYLTIKTGEIPVIREIYEKFKNYVITKTHEYERSKGESGESIENIISDLYKFSNYFVRMEFSERETDKELQEIFNDIKELKVDVAYPFLLRIYDDYTNKILNRTDFIQILKLVESYVFRRNIVELPTNSLNKTFATLVKEIDINNYFESISLFFAIKDIKDYTRFPKDVEFKNSFIEKNIYNSRNRNYILRKLENYNRREYVNVEDYTIEHIMPQNKNLSKEWRDELGEKWDIIQEHYLHTIGNLTLTGYNPQLSDNPFLKKRNMEGGFADSPIRLNRSLGKLEHWDEAAIKKRAEELFNITQKIWCYPQLSEETIQKKINELKKRQPEKIKYGIETHFIGVNDEIRIMFSELQKRILNLDSSITEEPQKLYIAYKIDTNFVDLVIQKSKIRIILNMKYEEVDDPKKITEDVSEKGRWGNGEVQIDYKNKEELEDIMPLIKQSFNKHYIE